METLNELFPVILNGLLIILVLVLIILVIKVIKTLKTVDVVVEDLNNKIKTLDGLFNAIDTATDALTNIGDKVSGVISNGLNTILSFKKNKGKKDEELEDE